jgi:SAM-dependent methyltransferase
MSKQEHDAAVAEIRQQMSTYDKPWFKSASGLLKRNNLNGLRCLDLCCGNCEYSQILRDEHEMEVTCADYIPFHLAQAEKDGFPRIAIDLDGDAEAVDRLADSYKESFDVVVSLATIEHVFDSDNLLRFAHRVLKPNGHLVVNTPNIGFLAYKFYTFFCGRPFGEGHHVRFWDYRFLRTNLFFNGFDVVEDAREFYSLPQDAMMRAFRSRTSIANAVSWLFHVCRYLQKLSILKGACCDELTVLAKKEDAPVMGFELSSIKNSIDSQTDGVKKAAAIARLRYAQQQGWLREHLYLTKYVDGLVTGDGKRNSHGKET